MIAYACRPGKGSEESVGWDTASSLARIGHHVVVLTRSSEAEACEDAAARVNNLEVVSWDIPQVLSSLFSRMGKLGVEFGYLFWLLKSVDFILALHATYQFTSAQHVTYARYWMPSPLRVLDIPWILGPVGGGESIPEPLQSLFRGNSAMFERIRDVMRTLGERSSAVRHAAQSCTLALANTAETADRLRFLGARDVRIMNSAALASEDLDRLAVLAKKDPGEQPEISESEAAPLFLSIGRLLGWKGFQLGLRAFAASGLDNARYRIIGEGPERASLEALAIELGIQDQVEFAGLMPREEVFNSLSSATALVHPSMHESGGYVCLESMAAGCPVICLRTGGPALFVDDHSGYPVFPGDPDHTIKRLADAMHGAATRPQEWKQRSAAGRVRVRNLFSMTAKVDELSVFHAKSARPDLDGLPKSGIRSIMDRDSISPDRVGLPSIRARVAHPATTSSGIL